ncbi:hypothetical protein F5883DRAFT_541225 [Diaporthe sp. PMI_573]|nr:hypothetical protein F5883DRAFT_541225 [Diaporthaceae sp. PMI_573]
MDPTLEWLPNELLDPILADLDVCDIASLTQCSRRLHGRLEPDLYKDTGRLHRAAEWGSKTGNIDCLRAAVRHGGQFDVFKLSFAARKGQDEAFGFMLDHGARIEVEPTDDRTLRHQVWKLMRALCRPGGFGMMRRFYEAGLDGQAREAGVCPQAVWPLDRIIGNGGPDVLERVRLVLGRGGVRLDVSWPNSGSLISLAIAANLPDVVDFLVAHGVDIHGKDGNKPRSVSKSRGWPCHIPVFAAAHEMAKSDHGIAMMRLVLQHGADINHRIKVLHWPRQGYFLKTDYYYTTPLFVFLDSVPSWKEGSGADLPEGLAFLIKHGAMLRLPDIKAPGGVLPMYKHTRPPVPIDLLLERWRLKTLNRPRFLAVIRALVKHGLQGAGSSPRDAATMITQHVGARTIAIGSPATIRERGLLLDVLLEGRSASESTSVLSWLLTKTGGTLADDMVGITYDQAVERLAVAGANADPVRVAEGSASSNDGVKLFVIRERPGE